MMDWQHHFGDVFFKTWKEGGFPNPEAYLGDYLKRRASYIFKPDYLKASYNDIPALESTLMNSVYGFGALHGELFGQLLGFYSEDSNHGADWCGKFNLGISLFDYLTDETSKGIEQLLSLNALNSFTNEAIVNDKKLSLTEEFLNNLISDVLEHVLRLKSDHSNNLMNHLKLLFNAQVLLSKHTLHDRLHLAEIYNALKLKSAGPFSAMAKYLVSKTQSNNSALVRKAEGLGTAIGTCYWLIDDAKDIWIDLEANEWNVFLHKVIEQTPELFDMLPKVDLSKHLTNYWKSQKYAEIVSQESISNLASQVNQLNVSKEVLSDTLGIIGASLWHWYTY